MEVGSNSLIGCPGFLLQLETIVRNLNGLVLTALNGLIVLAVPSDTLYAKPLEVFLQNIWNNCFPNKIFSNEGSKCKLSY